MAYVQINRKLIDGARDVVRGKANAEIRALDARYEQHSLGYLQIDNQKQPLPEYFDNLLWQGFKEQAAKLPTKWFDDTRSIWIEIAPNEEQGKLLQQIGRASNYQKTRLELTQRVPCSPQTATSDFRPGDIISVHGDAVPEFTEALQYTAARKEIEDRWGKVRRQVIDYLESYKSLGKAIAELPSIKAFIPAEALERLERKTTTAPVSTPVSKADAVDKGLIAAMAMRDRMSSNN